MRTQKGGGGLRGFKPPLNVQNFFLNCVFAKYTVQALLLYSLNRNFLQENVTNCTLISRFALASGGLCPPDPLPWALPLIPTGDFRPPDLLAMPPTT